MSWQCLELWSKYSILFCQNLAYHEFSVAMALYCIVQAWPTIVVH